MTQQLHRGGGPNGRGLLVGKRNSVPPSGFREAFLLNQVLKPFLVTVLALLDADSRKRAVIVKS